MKASFFSVLLVLIGFISAHSAFAIDLTERAARALEQEDSGAATKETAREFRERCRTPISEKMTEYGSLLARDPKSGTLELIFLCRESSSEENKEVDSSVYQYKFILGKFENLLRFDLIHVVASKVPEGAVDRLNSLPIAIDFQNDEMTFGRGAVKGAIVLLSVTASVLVAKQGATFLYPGQSDKELHAMAGALIGALATSLALEVLHRSKLESFLVGVASSLLAGIAKEFYDSKTGGDVDPRDVWATAFGGIPGATSGLTLRMRF